MSERIRELQECDEKKWRSLPQASREATLECGGVTHRLEGFDFEPSVTFSNRAVAYASKAVAGPPHSKALRARLGEVY
jgi:hypothetical protein